VRWSEYEREIINLQQRSKPLLVDEEVLCESVRIEELPGVFTEWKVFLGDQVTWFKNEKICYTNEPRMAYSPKESGWARLLGGLTTKITLAESLNDKLLNVMIEPYLKEIVMERLIGTQEIQDKDAETIIRTAAQKRIKRLENMLPEARHLQATFNLKSPSENWPLVIQYHPGSIAWGDLKRAWTVANEPSIKCCWSFLQNYDAVTKIIEQFAEDITPITKLLAYE
jgi:hypothetical protein